MTPRKQFTTLEMSLFRGKFRANYCDYLVGALLQRYEEHVVRDVLTPNDPHLLGLLPPFLGF
jgi:hypothetical protein